MLNRWVYFLVESEVVGLFIVMRCALCISARSMLII